MDHGVHAIIVPLRDLVTGAVLPGVEIRDCGYKVCARLYRYVIEYSHKSGHVLFSLS